MDFLEEELKNKNSDYYFAFVHTDSIEDFYTIIKDLFLRYVETYIGPFVLTPRFISRLYIEDSKIEYPSNSSKYVANIEEVWRRLVVEFCPTQILIPLDYNVEASISEVYDSTQYIYATGQNIMDKEVRILRLSDPRIAVILKLLS